MSCDISSVFISYFSISFVHCMSVLNKMLLLFRACDMPNVLMTSLR